MPSGYKMNGKRAAVYRVRFVLLRYASAFIFNAPLLYSNEDSFTFCSIHE